MFSCRPEKEAKQNNKFPEKIIKIGIIIMKLFILASALMLVLVFSSYVSANDPSDLDTAESQASFGYGYGTKVSNFMSSAKWAQLYFIKEPISCKELKITKTSVETI